MTNTWWEITIDSIPALEETTFLQLQEFGCEGTASQIKDNSLSIKAHLPSHQVQPEDLQDLASRLQQEAQQLEQPVPTVNWHLIEEEDWSNSWKRYWQPEEIGKRFLALPTWLSAPEDPERLILRIPPEMAFGTGTHATTQMCLEAMEMLLDTDSSAIDGAIVADIGCGSGILAIGALMLGASKAYAVDTDPIAVEATVSNGHLNGINPQQLIVGEGSIEKVQQMIEAPVDGIVCNIVAEAIINLMPQMAAIAKPTSWCVLSGISIDKAQSVTQAIEQSGWCVGKMWQRQEWCCFYVRRP